MHRRVQENRGNRRKDAEGMGARSLGKSPALSGRFIKRQRLEARPLFPGDRQSQQSPRAAETREEHGPVIALPKGWAPVQREARPSHRWQRNSDDFSHTVLGRAHCVSFLYKWHSRWQYDIKRMRWIGDHVQCGSLAGDSRVWELYSICSSTAP